MAQDTSQVTGPRQQADGTWHVRGDGWTVEGLGRPWQPEPLTEQDAAEVWKLRWYIDQAVAGKGADRITVEPDCSGDGGVWGLEAGTLLGFLWT